VRPAPPAPAPAYALQGGGGRAPLVDDALPGVPCKSGVFAGDPGQPDRAANGCADWCGATGGCGAFWSYTAPSSASYGRCCLKGAHWVNSTDYAHDWRTIPGGGFYALLGPTRPPTPAPPTPPPTPPPPPPRAACWLPYRAGSTSGYVARAGAGVRYASLYVDRARSSYNATRAAATAEPGGGYGGYGGYGSFRFSGLLRLLGNESAVRLHAFVDRSIVELFGAGGRAVATARVYPGRADSVRVGAFSAGGAGATLLALDAWEMGSAQQQQ